MFSVVLMKLITLTKYVKAQFSKVHLEGVDCSVGVIAKQECKGSLRVALMKVVVRPAGSNLSNHNLACSLNLTISNEPIQILAEAVHRPFLRHAVPEVFHLQVGVAEGLVVAEDNSVSIKY